MRKIEEITLAHLEQIAETSVSIKGQMNNRFQLDNLRWGIVRDHVLFGGDEKRVENEIQPSKVVLLNHCKNLWVTAHPEAYSQYFSYTVGTDSPLCFNDWFAQTNLERIKE